MTSSHVPTPRSTMGGAGFGVVSVLGIPGPYQWSQRVERRLCGQRCGEEHHQDEDQRRHRELKKVVSMVASISTLTCSMG
jgi:hypothetical protein